jgi:hypothetical protein
MAKQGGKISDEAVKAKTGKGWKEWFSLLDKAGARKMNHTGIAAYLYEKRRCSGWWSQTVANRYEQARGLRKKHQMPDGYQIGASRTLPVPLSILYNAFGNERIRRVWLAGDKMEVTTARKNKSIRGKWGNTRIDLNFYQKSEGKSQVSVGQNKIPNAKEAGRMKAYWKKALDALARLLAA